MARRRLWLGLIGVVGWWYLRSDDAAPPAPRPLQAAVLSDGFTIIAGAGDRHVLGYDDDGRRRFRRAVPLTAPDVRLVGASTGPLVGWREGAKLKLAAVTGDGELGETSTWGKSIRFQCDGVASNEHRFALGWADKDNRVWFVHGPVGNTRADEAPVLARIETTANISWCGIASAQRNILVVWREGSTTYGNFCTAKSCSAMVFKLPLAKDQALLGVGCTQDSCLLAARTAGGELRLGWIGETGKLAWSKAVTDAVPDTTFSIAGAGDRAIVVGYLTNTGATAVRVIASGSMVRAWHDPAAREAPSLVWARDRLFVAHRQGDAIVPEIVPLPR